MRVKVTEGYQVVDKDGKVQTSGTVELHDADARQAIAAGWATEAPASSSKKAPAARNKKQPASSNK
jgi:hypothetical protein